MTVKCERTFLNLAYCADRANRTTQEQNKTEKNQEILCVERLNSPPSPPFSLVCVRLKFCITHQDTSNFFKERDLLVGRRSTHQCKKVL